MRNMAFATVGNVVIALHSELPPSEEEWAEYTSAVKKIDVKKIRAIAFSDGGGPNSKQRKALNDVLAGRPAQGAVVSSSAVARSVVTALSWFNPLVKAFAPDGVSEAYRYLQLDSIEAQAVHLAVRGLAMKFTPPLRCVIL